MVYTTYFKTETTYNYLTESTSNAGLYRQSRPNIQGILDDISAYLMTQLQQQSLVFVDGTSLSSDTYTNGDDVNSSRCDIQTHDLVLTVTNAELDAETQITSSTTRQYKIKDAVKVTDRVEVASGQTQTETIVIELMALGDLKDKVNTEESATLSL